MHGEGKQLGVSHWPSKEIYVDIFVDVQSSQSSVGHGEKASRRK
jgi:hypothetical protein